VFGVKAMPETVPDPVRANVLHHYAGHAVSMSPAEAQRLEEEARKREEVEKATVVAQARSELARKWRAVTASIVLVLIVGLSGAVWYARRQERAAQEQAALVAAEVKKAVTVGDEAAVGGNWPQALESYTAGLALDPNNAALYAKRANVLAQLARPDDELADWDRAVHLLPQDPQLLLGRAQARLRTGRAEGAMEDLRLLLNSDPSNVEALTLLARAQENAGYIKDALATYSKLLESDANSPETIISRARVYQKLGDRQRAIADLQRATKLTQDPQLIAFAEAQLRELGVRPLVSTKPVEQIASVYVHFAVAEDRSVAQDLMKALQSQGLKAPSVVLKAGPVNGEVRYYYSQDLETAARAKRTVEVELAKQRYFVSLELRLLDTKVLKASPGVIEVWLPQLHGKEASRASPDIRDLNRRLLR
jgi:tetratricopeptide (TPR) repeat protein